MLGSRHRSTTRGHVPPGCGWWCHAWEWSWAPSPSWSWVFVLVLVAHPAPGMRIPHPRCIRLLMEAPPERRKQLSSPARAFRPALKPWRVHPNFPEIKCQRSSAPRLANATLWGLLSERCLPVCCCELFATGLLCRGAAWDLHPTLAPACSRGKCKQGLPRVMAAARVRRFPRKRAKMWRRPCKWKSQPGAMAACARAAGGRDGNRDAAPESGGEASARP